MTEREKVIAFIDELAGKWSEYEHHYGYIEGKMLEARCANAVAKQFRNLMALLKAGCHESITESRLGVHRTDCAAHGVDATK